MKEKDRDALRYISRVSGKGKVHIVILLLVQMILGASSVFYALLFRNVIDAATSHDRSKLVQTLLFLVGLVVLQITLRAVTRFVREYAKAGFENAFKKRLFSVILQKDYGTVTARHSGEWLNRLTSDTAVIADGLADILPGLAEMMTKMIGAVIMILVIEPGFGLILIPGGLLLVLLTWLFRKRLKRLHKEVQESDGRVRIFLQEHLESLMIIKSYATEKKSCRAAEDRMEAHREARLRRNHFSNFCNIGFAAAMNGAYFLGVFYGAYGIYQGKITYGTMMALLQLISQIQTPFANISGYLPKYYAMVASAERLMETEAFPDDGAGTSESRSENNTAKVRNEAAGRQVSGLHAESAGLGDNTWTEIGLSDASFSYINSVREDTSDSPVPVFEHMSLSVRKGEYVAFTGESGCGKSTVLRILMSLYALTGGERYIQFSDGGSAGAVRVQEQVADLHNSEMQKTAENRDALDWRYRSLFAYVPQGNLLMSGSIREVVTFSDAFEKSGVRRTNPESEGIDPRTAENQTDRIYRALEIACAKEFVQALPDGIETVLGERGAGLSEGQMQRLAIARAIYSNRPVLLLDEATSALDEDTEARLLENLRAMTDKTVIIVTHRKKALSICDREIPFTQSAHDKRI